MTAYLATTSMGESTLPPASIALLIAAAVVWLLGGAVVHLTSSPAVERRAYWAGYSVAGLLAALAFLFSGWYISVLVFLMVAVMTLSHAYFNTPYIVLGGRTISAKRRANQRGS
ncbi:hypothetical protein [Mycolicibacterium alvei]|uniref:Uncharacterized protein n=1 Tax=Mycolicibacterium alvei TaxID=67081 RepID=A0A6N4V1K5_9MYCO|nr:hypothetical protein [Mycolicibacterium alvei]MCV7003487.1 hypothetical protein [Mycolicibacterium alvei]BBX30559.1 hypothetical protein MALV_56840 [Mycolicibacterium alvei]